MCFFTKLLFWKSNEDMPGIMQLGNAVLVYGTFHISQKQLSITTIQNSNRRLLASKMPNFTKKGHWDIHTFRRVLNSWYCQDESNDTVSSNSIINNRISNVFIYKYKHDCHQGNKNNFMSERLWQSAWTRFVQNSITRSFVIGFEILSIIGFNLNVQTCCYSCKLII